MDERSLSAARVRRAELIVLGAGLVIALTAIALASRSAFEANMRWTQGTERTAAFLLTLASILLIVGLTVSPYALIAFLGRPLAREDGANAFQAARLVVCCAVTAASAYFYLDAVQTVGGPRASSTSAIVFAIVPVVLIVAGGGAYGVILFLHSRAR